jgi:hypothetical protein
MTLSVDPSCDFHGRAIYSRTGELKDRAAIDSVMQAIRWRPAPPDTTTPDDSEG